MYNEEKIIFSSLEGKPSFETVIDAIVYELFSDKNLNEIKNFIKKNCGSMINSNSDLINGNNYYSEMRGTKSFLDFTMCKDGGKNIRIYQQIQTYPKSLGVEIPYKKYLYNSDSYFASGGIIKNSFDNSNSDNNIFFDKVILHKIHKNNRENIIDEYT